MISLKSPREIEAMRQSGQIIAGMHHMLRDLINQVLIHGRLKQRVANILKAMAAYHYKLVLKALNMRQQLVLIMKWPMGYLVRD